MVDELCLTPKRRRRMDPGSDMNSIETPDPSFWGNFSRMIILGRFETISNRGYSIVDAVMPNCSASVPLDCVWKIVVVG